MIDVALVYQAKPMWRVLLWAWIEDQTVLYTCSRLVVNAEDTEQLVGGSVELKKGFRSIKELERFPGILHGSTRGHNTRFGNISAATPQMLSPYVSLCSKLTVTPISVHL